MFMEYLAVIGTVTLIHFLAVVSPGPDFIVAVRNSLTYSRITGLWTAVGFGLGIAVHVVYCVAGIAFLISQSIMFFNIIKFLGAAYLIYIGYKSFTSKSQEVEIDEIHKESDITPVKAVKMGFLTNVLNPKATLFFLSLFTLVISPETPHIVQGLMGVIMVINTTIWFSLVAVFFTQERVRKGFNKFQGLFNKVLGGLLIAVGIKVALLNK